MKIAIASDDRKTISNHFGKAFGFMVFDITNEKINNKEYRENIGKNSGECRSCNHSAMIKNIQDCKIVISFGMGQRIYDDLIKAGITPIVTDEKNVEDALKQFTMNNLKNMINKLH